MSPRIERETTSRKGPRTARSGLTRAPQSRVYGVASGLARYAGVDPALVQTAFVILSLAGGLGVVLYLGLALILPEGSSSATPPRQSGLRPVASVALITMGLLLGARRSGFWFGDALVLPAALAAFGASVLWVRSDQSQPGARPTALSANPIETLLQGRVSASRVVAGGSLIAVGMATFLALNADPYTAPFQIVRMLFLPVLATVAGLLLVFGPWLYRLAAQLSSERSDRIRSEERSALAAHLHDSVLQTLALIQRSDNAHRMAHLARTQERELRAWLFGKTGAVTGESLAGALEVMAGRCESRYPVSVEVVTVGDIELDDRTGAMTAACGEAISNAAAHSGSAVVSVYAEVEPDLVTLYVRDEGVGFDVDTIGVDRRGIRESIQSRMRRAGGTATILSSAGDGTEIILTLPRMAS